jgi:type II secretory pathway component PulJ
MFNSGILAVIFVLGGVLVTLMLPVLLNQISRWRFARRFERLVEANQIVPILTRDVEDAKTRSTQQRKRVSMESLLDAWIGGHHAPSRSQEWKVRI